MNEENNDKKKEKKPNIFWRGYMRDGKGVEKGDVIKGYSTKNFFRLYFRRFTDIMTTNLLYIFGNFPVLFLFLAISGYFDHNSVAPSNPLFALLYGIEKASGGTPSSSVLAGIFSGTSEVSAPTAVTYILYGISALLIVTFGLVNTGCTYLMRETVRGEHIFIFDDFISAIKKNFRQALLFGVFDLAMLCACSYAVIWYRINYSTYYVLFYCALVMTAIYLFMRSYMYIMIVTFDLKWTKILKNSFIFSILSFGKNLLALLCCLVLVAAAFLFSMLFMPIGIIFAILLLFSTMTYITMYFEYPKVEKLMIEPYQKQNHDESEPEITGEGHAYSDDD